MNRIDQLFSKKQGNILSVYFTAGYPGLYDTVPIITALERSGADMIEIGIPFSDPLADGPVIQKSSQQALANGMSLKLLFGQLRNIRNTCRLPLLLMGYLNPVLRFGFEKFLDEVSAVGIDGVILPDLPPEECETHYADLFEKKGICPVMLVTPQTSPERIRKIDSLTKGFLYMVSSAATTGSGKDPFKLHLDYFKSMDSMELKSPRLVGFGISDRKSFLQACNHARGAIIGSAFIRALETTTDIAGATKAFVTSIVPA